MSNKKKFTIAPDLASGIRTTIQSASNNQGQLHYDIMSLDIIEPDPQNPRKLLISRNEILQGVNEADINYNEKVKELAALQELSESIKRIGIKNAIEVYKNGLKYRIVTGERRYWAAHLAGQKSVPVHISQKPNEFNLRYTQWVENINRQDLSLWEKFNNLQLIANGYHESHQEAFTEQILQNLLGISNIQAYRYFCLLKADEKIIRLIEMGKINNLKLIQELVSMKDKGARNQIIAWISASKEEVTSLTHYRAVAGKKFIAKKKNYQSITLLKINNFQVAKKILEIVLSDSRLNDMQHEFKNINWDSPKELKKAFEVLFRKMEAALNLEEMV